MACFFAHELLFCGELKNSSKFFGVGTYPYIFLVSMYKFQTHNPISLGAILDLSSNHDSENVPFADLVLGTSELATHNRSRGYNRTSCCV